MGPIQLRNAINNGSHSELGGVGDAAKVVLIDPVTGLPYGGSSGGGGGGGVGDMLFTDDASVQFVYRDNGATPPVFTAYRLPQGTVYTVGANPRPFSVRDVQVTVSALPAGAATSAAQATSTTQLTTINTNLGVQADTRATWFDAAATLLSHVKLLIAATVGAGSHAYGYSGTNLVTDAWTLFGTTRTKTYTYTSGILTAESDWV